MRTKFLTIILLFATSLQMNAQSGVPIIGPPPPSPVLNVTNVGTPGFNTYYYLVVANYTSGQVQSQIVSTGSGNATLSGSNYNAVGWQSLVGVKTFDVLRLSGPSFSGSCTCALATGVAGNLTSYSDTGGSLSSYTASKPAFGANSTLLIDNLGFLFPKLLTTVGGGALPAQGAHDYGYVPTTDTLVPEYAGASVSTTTGTTDTLSAPLLSVQNALPLISTNGSLQKTVTGEIDFKNTGVGTNRYNATSTMLLSSGVLYKGAGTNASTFGIPTTGWTGSNTYYFDTIQRNSPANQNFNLGIQALNIDLTTNVSTGSPVNGLSLYMATGSFVKNTGVSTYGTAFIIGGQGVTPNADNVLLEDDVANVSPISGVIQGQGFVFPSAGIDINSIRGFNNKLVSGPSTSAGRLYALDFGGQNRDIQWDTTNIENMPLGVKIGPFSVGEKATNTVCTMDGTPYTGIVCAIADPTAINADDSGTCVGYLYCSVVGAAWGPSETLSTTFEIVDYNGHVQQVTTGGITGTAIPQNFSTTGGTTSDNTVVWTDEGLLSTTPCNVALGTLPPCAMATIVTSGSGQAQTGPVGRTSTTDNTLYKFNYDSNEFWTGQQNIPVQSFTPAITIGGSGTGITYCTQTGNWWATGSYASGFLYWVNVRVVLNALGSNTGDVVLTGLPSYTYRTAFAAGFSNNIATSGTTAPITALLTGGGNASLYVNSVTTGSFLMTNGNLVAASGGCGGTPGTEIDLTMTYHN